MKKTNILISTVLAGILLVGCGSNGNRTTAQSATESSDIGTTASSDTAAESGGSSGTSSSGSDKSTTAAATKEESIIVAGSVVDGPIYGGAVKIYGLDDSLLGNATTDSAGGYSTTIPNLPQRYKIKVNGGTDSGADGIANSNDKALGFDMSAVVDRSGSNDGTAHVTPATTIVDKIVEDGVIPLDDAQGLVKDGLGLGDESYPLCRLDPNKHDRANKAGSFIALLLESIQSSDKKAILRIIAKSFAQKEIKVKISNTNTQIETLDLVTLAKRVADESPDSISLLDIDKLEKCQALIVKSMEQRVTRTRVTHLMTTTEQEEILAYRSALTTLLQKMTDTDLESLDATELETLYGNIIEGMKIVLAGGKLDASDPDNAALIADVIAANLDKEPADISEELIKLSHQYQLTIKKIKSDGTIKYKKSTKKIIRAIYSRSSLDKLNETIASLSNSANLQKLAEVASSIEDQTSGEDTDMKSAFRLALQQTIAGQLSYEIEALAGRLLTTDHITQRVSETLGNDILISQLRSTLRIKITLKSKGRKIRLSIRERAKITACNQVLTSMRMSVRVKGFTTLDDDSIAKMLEHITTTLEESHDEESREAYEEKIKALQLTIVNLSKKFDSVDFKSRTKTTIRIIKKIKITTGSDLYKSIVKIKIKIRKDFVKTTTNLKATIEELEKYIERIVVKKTTKRRLIQLPQPRLETLPTTPIMIAI